MVEIPKKAFWFGAFLYLMANEEKDQKKEKAAQAPEFENQFAETIAMVQDNQTVTEQMQQAPTGADLAIANANIIDFGQMPVDPSQQTAEAIREKYEQIKIDEAVKQQIEVIKSDPVLEQDTKEALIEEARKTARPVGLSRNYLI